MRERRAYLRFRAPIRLRVRRLSETSEEVALRRVRGRRRSLAPMLPGSDDARSAVEAQPVLEILREISATLERIEDRLSDPSEREEARVSEPEISLSASGIAIPLGLFDPAKGALVELELELPDDGIPRIRALARVVRSFPARGRRFTALSFDGISGEDRERLVQVALRRDFAELRERRAESRA